MMSELEVKIVVVVDNKYLAYEDCESEWTDKFEEAYPYMTRVAFHVARKRGGKVALLFPSGKLIEVSKEDFGV